MAFVTLFNNNEIDHRTDKHAPVLQEAIRPWMICLMTRETSPNDFRKFVWVSPICNHIYVDSRSWIRKPTSEQKRGIYQCGWWELGEPCRKRQLRRPSWFHWVMERGKKGVQSRKALTNCPCCARGNIQIGMPSLAPVRLVWREVRWRDCTDIHIG